MFGFVIVRNKSVRQAMGRCDKVEKTMRADFFWDKNKTGWKKKPLRGAYITPGGCIILCACTRASAHTPFIIIIFSIAACEPTKTTEKTTKK
jgi:hypothetical protein